MAESIFLSLTLWSHRRSKLQGLRFGLKPTLRPPENSLRQGTELLQVFYGWKLVEAENTLPSKSDIRFETVRGVG